jgi:hypothetical protein
MFNTHLHINTVLMERTSGRNPGSLTKIILDMEGSQSRDRMLSCLEGRLDNNMQQVVCCSCACPAFFWTHVVFADVSVQHRALRWPAALRVGVAARGREQFREGVMRKDGV